MSPVDSPTRPEQAARLEPAPATTGARGDAPAPSRASDRAALRTAALLTLLVALVGWLARAFVVGAGLAVPLPASLNVFYYLFGNYEGAPIAIAALGALAVLLLGARATPDAEPGPTRALPALNEGRVWLLAGAVFAVAALGNAFVFRGALLSMDEWVQWFQARIFLSGRIEAPLPAHLVPIKDAVLPVFIRWRESTGAWMAAYLPVYTATRAALLAVGLDRLTNPLYALLTVPVFAAVARRLWPEQAERRWIALLFLVTSAQFLVTSMSGYAMSAHLLFNLAFLALYLRDDRLGHASAPWVGALALGINNPFPHALFVAPFLLRLVRRREIGRAAYYGGVYLACAAAWFAWLRFSYPEAQSSQGLFSVFTLPGVRAAIVAAASVTLLFTWQAPVAVLCATAAVLRWRERSEAERDLALGIVATLAFYLFFGSDQGHGWGYRYAYNVLGNLALLGACGAGVMTRALGERRARALLAASFAVALLVQLPLRAREAQQFTRPFANAFEFFEKRPEKVLLYDPNAAWYARDLLRNDPLLEQGPIVVSPWPLNRGQLNALVAHYGGPQNVHVVTTDELSALGLHVWQPSSTQSPTR